MGAARQPAHEPAAPLISQDFAADRFRIALAIFPYPAIDQAHQVRIARTAATSLVRRQEHLGPQQRRNSNVLYEIYVVTDEDSGAESVRCVKDGEIAAGFDVFVLEGVKLAVAMDPAIGHRHHIAV